MHDAAVRKWAMRKRRVAFPMHMHRVEIANERNGFEHCMMHRWPRDMHRMNHILRTNFNTGIHTTNAAEDGADKH